MSAISAKDWTEFVRDRRLLLAAVLVTLLGIAAVATSFARVSAYETDRRATEARDRTTWEGQGARNPHSAAHFSNWALRPLTPLALLDPGVTPYAGSAVWMEAHNQNPPRARAVEDLSGAFDLGAFSAAWILQTLMPLLIFVIGAGAVARERERGTLRLMLASGLGARRLVPGKAAALGRIAALLAVPLIVVALAAAVLAGPADPLRLLLWSGAYALFFAIVAVIAVVVSAASRTASQAMLALIGLWLIAVVLVPRAGAGLAAATIPAPTPDAFWSAMIAEIDKQPDPFDSETFGPAMAKRYGVATVEDLPVSLAGLQLDESERVGNAVFDSSYGALADTYGRQRALLSWTGLVSPIAPLQNISMALAGTDMASQLSFQRQAEALRRQTIGVLNGDMTANGKGKDFDYQAGSDLWKTIPAFRYRPPALGAALGSVIPDILILAAWSGLAGLLLVASGRWLERGER